MKLFIKNQGAIYVAFSELIIVVKKWNSLIGLGLAYEISPTGLGKNAGPLSFSYNWALPWLGASAVPLIPALYSYEISSQYYDQPFQRPEFIHPFIHSINTYCALLCAKYYSENWGCSSDQTDTILVFVELTFFLGTNRHG